MHTIRNTLVVMDPQQSEEQILNRARMIASSTRSHLHLLVCDKRPDLSPHLEEVRGALEKEGFSVSAQRAWHHSLYQTVIAAQQAEGCGLVIKQHRPDNPLTKSILTPEDWKLLRYCPSPVLIVKTTAPWASGTILAAVDVGNSDIEHRVLHAGIVSHGHDVAKLSGGTLHMMSAHPYPMLSAPDPVFQRKESIEDFYREQCRTLQKEFGIDDERLHIEEGAADILIPQVARKLNAALTVIGNVARTGLAGAMIGNTAEMVLDTLESDVLVLKPDDVITHLEELAAPAQGPQEQAALSSWPYNHHNHRQ
ncbi:universal stress protein [Pseudomonas sp. MOB-449]|nr:universal stress protein [Pseudomonas sp. MOB-449]